MADGHEWTPEYYYTGNGDASAVHERGLDFETFMQRTAQQNEEGLPVRLEVPKWNWKNKPWDLLMIYTKPTPGFAHRSTWAKMAKLADEGFRYHISLCQVSEAPEDKGWDAYERIRERYDGKEGVLKISVFNAQATFVEGFNTFTDAIIKDPDIALLHNAGKYSNRPLHVST